MPKGGIIAALGLLLMAYASATATSWFSLSQLWSLATAYVVGYLVRDLRTFWGFIIAVLGVWFLISGLLPFELNRNALGAAFVLALAAGIIYEYWFGAALMAAGVITTQSRTALAAMSMVALVSMWRESKVIAACGALILLVLIFTFSEGRGASIAARLGIWQDTLNHLTIWGHGWGSFPQAYAEFPVRTNMTLELAPAAYNDYLQLLFELGVGSALAWALVLFSLEGERPKLILLAFATLSMGFFPLYTPIVGHLGMLALGHAAKKEI